MATLDGVNGTVYNAPQYQPSSSSYNNPNLTRGQSIGLAVSTSTSILVLNSPRLQLTAEASSISCAFVVGIFIWIGVRRTLFHVSAWMTGFCIVECTMV